MSHYQQACQAACQSCRSEDAHVRSTYINEMGGHHYTGRDWVKCSAPSLEAFAEEQAARAASITLLKDILTEVARCHRCESCKASATAVLTSIRLAEPIVAPTGKIAEVSE